MRSEWMCAGLLLLAAGCGGSASAATQRLSRTSHLPVDLPEPTQFDESRNFVAEYEDFQRLVSDQHVDTDEVGKALGVPPSDQFAYKTMDGAEMRGFEYKLQGPRKDAPFFEAFGGGYPNQSFFVFFEKSWFGWKAVDCGFHVSGVLGPLAAAE